jgi:glycosyltransferase involved in cell wall biosynthesis
MNNSTLGAKFIPLSGIEIVNKIYIIRKYPGPEIDKVEYIVLPGICRLTIFYLLISPFILAWHTRKKQVSLILGYHIIPHAFFAWIASILTGVPYAIGQTGLYIQRYTNQIFIRGIVHNLIKKSLFLNVPGQYSKDFWIKKGVLPEKINLLHSTVDTSRFYNQNLDKKYDLIFIGRFSPEKNIDLLINGFYLAVKEMPELTFALVGDGFLQNKLYELVKKLGLEEHVLFIGKQDNVEQYLNQSRIFIMASASEGLPLALMEAMACELLVLSTCIGNISDILKHKETGLVINHSEPSIIAEIVSYHSHEYARKMWRPLLNNPLLN